MKTIITKISLILSAIALFSISCSRKPLHDDCLCNSTLSVPVSIDWSISGVEPKNVTILFYDSFDGGLASEHIFEHNSEEIQSYASLAAGSYTAVIFNELRDQIDHVSCLDHQNIATLKFKSCESDPLRSRSETRNYIKEPGDFAIATIENIVVTNEMIFERATTESADTVQSLLEVTPLRKSTTINIEAHIKNIYYARMPALVDLVNIADGYYVHGDKNSDTPATLQFTMNNRAYDSDSYYDGTISTSVTTFGTLWDRSSTSGHNESTPILVDILFKMIDTDQSEESLQADATSHITHEQQQDGSMLINIVLSLGQGLPAVEPEGSGGDSGFDAEVEDWEDVYIPLKQ